MTDEELLILYHKYKKKRTIIISIIVVVIFILLSITFIYFHFNNASSSVDKKEPEEVIVKDEVAPIIKLKINALEILKGDDIKYLDYVESVNDDVDGDLFDKLEYQEIDTSKLEEQNIIYSVSDSSGNSAQEIIKVVIKESEEIENSEPQVSTTKPSVSNPSPPKVEQTPPKVETDSKPSEAQKPPVTQQPETKPQGKIVKYFLFSDGYTMKNVAEACAAELKKTNRTGMCSPIQDENGIYLGMKLETS